jgi:hypothetical protein
MNIINVIKVIIMDFKVNIIINIMDLKVTFKVKEVIKT